ncbi:MAG TPA: ferrochelatase [Polyangiaceae bacterium]|nr:ferrochelatase [Polyangiaceae bacterium]
MSPPSGVLLSAHGTVTDPDDIPAFLQNIRRGRPTPQAIVDEVRHRFHAIGGSPLLATTRGVAEALASRLGAPVFVGMRLWHPYIAEALDEAERRGVRRLLSLPLAPQSTHVYNDAVREALAARRAEGRPVPELVEAPPWGLEPLLVGAFAEAVGEALARFEPGERGRVGLALSAHSLPKRVIDAGDPYERQFREMADAVAARVGHPGPTLVAFQSQGMDGGEWLGPDLPRAFAELRARGAEHVVVAAIGFLSDHVETLYDLDVDAPRLAREAGFGRFERAPSLNLRPAFLDALEAVARRGLGLGPA